MGFWTLAMIEVEWDGMQWREQGATEGSTKQNQLFNKMFIFHWTWSALTHKFRQNDGLMALNDLEAISYICVDARQFSIMLHTRSPHLYCIRVWLMDHIVCYYGWLQGLPNWSAYPVYISIWIHQYVLIQNLAFWAFPSRLT